MACRTWKDYSRYDDENPMDQILDHLWIGNLEAVCSANNMDAVVSAVNEDRITWECLKNCVGDRAHFWVNIRDKPDEPIEEYFVSVSDFIHKYIKQNKNVLVHCAAGHSRSVTLVIYYLMRYQGYKTVDEALQKIQQHRPYAQPSNGFLKKVGDRFRK